MANFPITFGLTDRDTKEVLMLRAQVKGERLVLSSVARNEKGVVFPARSGPMLSPTIRLILRGGRLGYEDVAAGPVQHSYPPMRPYDRLARRFYELKLPAGFTGSEALVYETAP